MDSRNERVFVSDPLDQPTEFSGLFSGRLDFMTNKEDMDIGIALYEQMTDGRYFRLSWYIARASYSHDRNHREFLSPGKKEQLAFTNGRLSSRLLQSGSRLVMVLSIIKEPDIQINYGTRKDVSDETIQDAKEPLLIKWFEDSYIEVPIRR